MITLSKLDQLQALYEYLSPECSQGQRTRYSISLSTFSKLPASSFLPVYYSSALYANYPNRHHMSTTTNPRGPLILGNVCHITANELPSSNIPVKDADEVAKQRRLHLRHIFMRLLRRCSTLKPRGHPVEDRRRHSEWAPTQTAMTPPSTSPHNHQPDLEPQGSYNTANSATAMLSDTATRKESTASSTSSSLSNTEAWKLSLVLPFMDHARLQHRQRA